MLQYIGMPENNACILLKNEKQTWYTDVRSVNSIWEIRPWQLDIVSLSLTQPATSFSNFTSNNNYESFGNMF